MEINMITVTRPMGGTRIVTNNYIPVAFESAKEFLKTLSNMSSFIDEITVKLKKMAEYIVDAEEEVGSESNFTQLCCEISGLSRGDQSLLAKSTKKDLCFKCDEFLMHFQLYLVITDCESDFANKMMDELIYKVHDKRSNIDVFEIDLGSKMDMTVRTYELCPDEIERYNNTEKPLNKEFEYLNAIRVAHWCLDNI